MSQRFSPKMDEMRQNDPVSSGFEPEPVIKDDGLYYPSCGNVRHVCFCWPDGRKFFLNYAYLISVGYDPGDNSIVLSFSTHNVTLRGVNLESTFFKLMGQQLRLLQCIDPRYNSLGVDRSIVNSIEITANTQA